MKDTVFIHPDIDLYDLDPYQFRLYIYIGRRGQYPSTLETISKTCKVSTRKTQLVLKELQCMGLIEKTNCKVGRTHLYRITPRTEWRLPEYKEKNIFRVPSNSVMIF